MTSFFGSIRSLFKTKDKPGQPTRISKYEDEIKLLLDTGTLDSLAMTGRHNTKLGNIKRTHSKMNFFFFLSRY